jgi:hypothetical protein
VYDHDRYLETLSVFSKMLLTSYDVETVLSELAAQTSTILGLVGSGVSLNRDGKVAYATAVPDQLASLELVQHEAQSGPCLEAFRTGQTVAVDDLRAAVDRWPEYCAEAARVGISSVAAVPLALADEKAGSLDLYSEATREWEREDLAAAQVMADMATGYLINASKLDQQVQLATQLGAALDSRVVIEQAKGVVAERAGITVDEAFQRLRRHAREHQADIHAVARAVVDLGLGV